MTDDSIPDNPPNPPTPTPATPPPPRDAWRYIWDLDDPPRPARRPSLFDERGQPVPAPRTPPADAANE